MQPEEHHAHEPETPPPVHEVQPPTGDADIDQQVKELVKRWGYDHSPELIEEMVGTVLKMAQDRMSVADLKMYNRSLKELRYAARLFAQYRPISQGVGLWQRPDLAPGTRSSIAAEPIFTAA